MSLLLGLCHSVGVCSSTNLFLKASKSSEADFLCSIDFFSIHAIFLHFSYWKIILLLKFFSLAFLIVFLLLCCQRMQLSFLKLSLRSCHFLNRQPAEWNPLYNHNHGYLPVLLCWSCSGYAVPLSWNCVLKFFWICSLFAYLFILLLPLHFIFCFFSFC